LNPSRSYSFIIIMEHRSDEFIRRLIFYISADYF
jgi:hypothetical protein